MLRACLAALLCVGAEATTPAPGVNYVCEENNYLGDNATGNVNFQNYDIYHTECWHIECDKDVVISFANMQLYHYSYLDLYTGKNSGNGTDFTLEKSFNSGHRTPPDVVLSGSVFVHFRGGYLNGWSRLEFDYVCVDATATDPPTPAPRTAAPGVNHVCEEYNDLGDKAAGNVNFQNFDIYHTECWHIECDKEVVISFSTMRLVSFSYLDLYAGKNSVNGTDFTLEKSFYPYDARSTDVVLTGSVVVQFRSTSRHGWSRLKFDYVCTPPTDAPTSAPDTRVPEPRTRAPGVHNICDEHNDLGDNTTGNVSFQSHDNYHTECWYIECDKDVVISFSNRTQLNTYSDLHLYEGKNSGTATDFTLEKSFNVRTHTPVEVVLNGSAFVQLRTGYLNGGWARVEFDYVCVDDATTPAPPTPAPRTPAPGVNYVCEEHNYLNDLGDNATGNVNFQNYDIYHTECWHIECDKDVVISFANMQLYHYSYLDLYTRKNSGIGADFTLEKSFNSGHRTPPDVVLSGSVFVHFRGGYLNGWSRLEFDYVCVDATTPAPPTPAPRTPAPGVNHVCGEYNDLGDKAAGKVDFQNYESYHTECWHIECDKEVVISFSTMQLVSNSYLYLYAGKNSGTGTDFTLEKTFGTSDGYRSGTDIVLTGSVVVQFRSTSRSGWSRLKFDYVCTPPTDAPTSAPDTRVPEPRTYAPGVHNICDEHNDLGDNKTGNVSFQAHESDHTECWHIECDKDVVISFSTMQVNAHSDLLLYTRKNSGTGTYFTWEKSFTSGARTPVEVVLSGSAFVMLRTDGDYDNSRLEFDYVCVDATTPAPPTPAPRTPAPGVNHACEENNDLGDKAAGNVSFQNYDRYHTECWHIECDKHVVITFDIIRLNTYSYLDLYTGKNSVNGTDFTLEKSFAQKAVWSRVEVVLSGSAFVQFRSTYYGGKSELRFDYECVTPDTAAPGVNYICDEHNDLGDNKTGNVSFQNYDIYHTECWHIECDKDVVISFANMQLFYESYLYLYTGKDSGNETDFALQRAFQYNEGTPGDDVVLSGSVFVQFRSGFYYGWSRLEFDYVCVDATTPAPPAAAPHTAAPGVNHICDEHNDLGDNATGNVSFQNYDIHHTECWHIECDEEVVISFSTMQLYYSYLYLYTSGNESGNGTDFALQRTFQYNEGTPGDDVVLSGSVFVQFRSGPHDGWSRLEFDYECVDATTPAPPTPAPRTPAPGVNYTCEEHSNLTGTGYENLENSRSHYKYCWHIECDYDVVLKFTDIELYSHSYVSIYSSGTGTGNETNFTLEHDWSSHTSGFEGVELVVRGSAFVQFRSTYHYGRSYLAFQYECRAPTPPPQQQQCGVDTVPQRCGQGTSRACAFEVRHPARLLSVAFSGDGSRVATGAADRVVRVFDARTGVQVSQLGCADFKVHDIAFSPDNKLVALAGEGGRVVVCNAATGVLEATLMDMSASGSTPVHRVEFTRDGRYAVSGGGSDSRTRIFDLLSSDMTNASSVLDHHARNVAFSVDGAHLATVRGTEVDEVTSVWSLDGTSAVELPSVGVRVTALSFSSSAGGNVLLRGMSDGTILVSQLLDGFGGNSTGGDGGGNTGGDGGGNSTRGGGDGNTGGDGDGNTGGDGGGNSTRGGGDGNTGGDGDGNTGGDGGGGGHGDDVGTSPWDSSVVEGVSLSLPSGIVYDSKFSRNGQKIAAVGGGDVMVWSHDGSVLHELLGHSPAILPRLDFSPDGTRLATVSRDGTLVVWKL